LSPENRFAIAASTNSRFTTPTMPPGISYARKPYTKCMPLWLFILFLMLFTFTHSHLFTQPDNPALTRSQFERMIASSIFLDGAANLKPAWSNITAPASKDTWEVIQTECTHAVDNDFFPLECYTDWALAAHWFGELETATNLVHEMRIANPTNSLTKALILAEPPDQNSLRLLEDLSEQNLADWKQLYLLHHLDEETNYLEEIWLSGNLLYTRNFLVTILLWPLLVVGACAILWILIRKPFKQPSCLDTFRFFSLWKSRRVLGLFIGGFALGGVMFYASAYIPAYTMPAWSISSMFSYAVFLGTPTVVLLDALTPGPKAALRLFGLHRSPYSKKALVLTSFATFTVCWAYSYVQGTIELWIGVNDVRDWLSMEALDSHWALLNSLFAAVIVAPICEEICCRGFLFNAFRNRWGSVWGAVFSSAVFASYHGYAIGGWISVFVFGMILCGVYRRVGTLWPCILTHALFNLVLTLYVWANYSFV
jgi:membrane protease YdiL (CAAX protease family)